jgi:alkylhydroperoxidase family enzyme
MRIDVPDAYAANPMAFVAATHVPEIVQAGFAFSRATYESTTLTLREFEGARARTAEINGCRICRSWRSARDLPAFLQSIGGDGTTPLLNRGPAPDDAYYHAVSQWRSSPLYSVRERIAIEYAEGMGTDPQGIAQDEDFWRRFRAAFSDREIVDLSFCIACWMGLGRVGHVLSLDGICAIDTSMQSEPAVAEPDGRPITVDS